MTANIIPIKDVNARCVMINREIKWYKETQGDSDRAIR